MPLPARGVLAPSVWYMSRSAPSRADQALIAHAASYGRHATARQLERWRTQGLLPPNIRSYPGRGAGSASQPASGAGDLVVWLTEHARRGRRPGDLALFAFGAGLAVPEATVRAAFADAVNRDRLGVEHDLPHDSDPEDVAATVATGVRGTILPARMRRFDEALADAGVGWSSPELAAHDPGRVSEPVTGADWAYTAVHASLSGGSAVDLDTMGAAARAMLPAGAFAPVAAWMETAGAATKKRPSTCSTMTVA